MATRLRSDLLRNATWMLSGQTVRLIGQAAYFVIVGHVLGAQGYGAFVACTSLMNALNPFAALGTGHVMVKRVAVVREALPEYFGAGIVITAASGLLLGFAVVTLTPVLLPAAVPLGIPVLVAIADMICTPVTDLCSMAFLALGNAQQSTRILVVQTALRFLGSVVLVFSAASPTKWACLYTAAAVIAAACGLNTVRRHHGMPRFRSALLVPTIRQGFHFATAQAAQTVYNDIDKTMLARLNTLESAAIYAVAYRFIEAAALPIRSVQAATYPEFFRKGTDNIAAAFTLARRILRRSVLYGLGTTAALFVAAPLVSLIMGKAYTESTTALRWLCVLCLIKSIHAFLSDTLTGAGYQWQRSSTQIAVAAFNILINLWLIRAFSWRGAAWSSILSDTLLMALLYMIIRINLARECSLGQRLRSLSIIERA